MANSFDFKSLADAYLLNWTLFFGFPEKRG